jgi:acyl-CoA thioesterase FadM
VTTGALCGETIIDNLTEEEVHGSVITTSENGQVVERIKGYVAKIMEFHEDYPTPEEIVDPGQRDEAIILDKTKILAGHFSVSVPEISLAHLPGLRKLTKNKRRQLELPPLKRVAQQSLAKEKGEKKELNIKWLDSGKPVVDGEEFANWNISLSHDNETVFCVAGEGFQGCDIETVTSRTREEWFSLLGKKKEFLLDTLINGDNSIDQAGTRIWTAMEAGAKAMGSKSFKLQITKQTGVGVLFLAEESVEQEVNILTFPVSLTRGPERMVAVIVKPAEKGRQLTNSIEDQEIINELSVYENLFTCQMDFSGPQNQLVFTHIFPLTFRQSQHFSRRVYFTNFIKWMGESREYGSLSIADLLAAMAKSGGWGAATNYTSIDILGDVEPSDTVESRMWVENILGAYGEVGDLCFDFRRIISSGARERVAIGKLRFSNLKIIGHGLAKLAPMPDFYKEFMNKMLPRTAVKSPLEKLPEKFSKLELGKLLFFKPPKSKKSNKICEMVFETGMEHSNLIGNIYYSNYSEWMGILCDRYFHSVMPAYYSGIGKNGELICLHSSIDHLREAMPFDTVIVQMFIDKVYEHGAELYFEFYLLDNKKIDKKLAVARHKVCLVKWDTNSEPVPQKLPKEAVRSLIDKGKVNILDVKSEKGNVLEQSG